MSNATPTWPVTKLCVSSWARSPRSTSSLKPAASCRNVTFCPEASVSRSASTPVFFEVDADLRPLERDRRADGDALHRALEVRNRRLGQPEEPPAAEDDEADDRQRQPAHDERSDESGIGPSSHAASLRPTRRG